MRRNARFVIITLLVAILALCTWLVVEAAHLRAKFLAVQTIERLGGVVCYDYQWSEEGAWRPTAEPPGPAWLRALLGDQYAAEPVEIQLFKDRKSNPETFTDIEVRQLSVLRELRWLVLMDTSITDDSLSVFSALLKLERLDIEGSQVSDSGVAKLRAARPDLAVQY